jgi:hypothetical protein
MLEREMTLAVRGVPKYPQGYPARGSNAAGTRLTCDDTVSSKH